MVVLHNTTFFPLPQKQFQSTGKWLASKAVRETETWPGLRQRTSGDNLKGHYRAMGKQTTEVWSQTTYIVVAPQNAIHFCFGGKYKSVKKIWIVKLIVSPNFLFATPQEYLLWWYFDYSLTNGTLRRLKGPKGWKQEKRSGLCMSKMRFQVLPTFG